MEIKQCNRNPFFLADFAYDGEFSDGNENGDVVVTMPYIKYEDGHPVFVDGKVERINRTK